MDEGLKLRIAAVAAASRRFLMRDLTEEFIAAEIWPVARSSSFLVTPCRASRELVTTEDDGSTNLQREGFVWTFPGESSSWEFCALRRVSPDSSWWIPAGLAVEEVERRATVLLGPYREDENTPVWPPGSPSGQTRSWLSGVCLSLSVSSLPYALRRENGGGTRKLVPSPVWARLLGLTQAGTTARRRRRRERSREPR